VIVRGVLSREPSVEFVCAQDVGLTGCDDEAAPAYAAENGFLVVSHDLSTMPPAAYERLATGKAMYGLLLADQGKPTRAIIESLLLIWSASDAEEHNGIVKYLPL